MRDLNARFWEQSLALGGILICLITCIRVAQTLSYDFNPSGHSNTLFPFPGLYLLEMLFLSVLALVGAFNAKESPVWSVRIWAAVGAQLAFVVLGAWSIGLFFLPTALMFTIAAFLIDYRRQRILVHSAVCVVAGIVQSVLMLTIIRWL